MFQMSIVGLKLWKYFPKSIGIQETTIQDNSEPEQDTQHTSTGPLNIFSNWNLLLQLGGESFKDN